MIILGKVKQSIMIKSMEDAYEMIYGKITDDTADANKNSSALSNETINNSTTKGE